MLLNSLLNVIYGFSLCYQFWLGQRFAMPLVYERNIVIQEIKRPIKYGGSTREIDSSSKRMFHSAESSVAFIRIMCNIFVISDSLLFFFWRGGGGAGRGSFLLYRITILYMPYSHKIKLFTSFLTILLCSLTTKKSSAKKAARIAKSHVNQREKSKIFSLKKRDLPRYKNNRFWYCLQKTRCLF